MYAVAKIKTTRCETLHSDSEVQNKHEFKYIEATEFGRHSSNIEAKRALVCLFDVGLKDSPDEHIKRCAKEHISGKKSNYKIIKVAA